jgi:hypothetical protein
MNPCLFSEKQTVYTNEILAFTVETSAEYTSGSFMDLLACKILHIVIVLQFNDGI